jgi:ABC-type uncharacterized transport system YnjBCD substrate-binding protein
MVSCLIFYRLSSSLWKFHANLSANHLLSPLLNARLAREAQRAARHHPAITNQPSQLEAQAQAQASQSHLHHQTNERPKAINH